MLLHNSTTLWHRPHEVSVGHNQRPVFGVWSTLKGWGGKAVDAGKGVGGLVTSKPARLVAPPFFWLYDAHKKAGEAIKNGLVNLGNKIVDTTLFAGRTVFEAGKTIYGTRNSVARVLYESFGSMARPIKHLLVDNTRDTLGNVFNLGAKTISGGVNTLGKVVKLPLLPFKWVNNTRKGITKVLFNPVESITQGYEKLNSAADTVWNGALQPINTYRSLKNDAKAKVANSFGVFKPIANFPVDVYKNTKEAGQSSWASLVGGYNHGSNILTNFKEAPKRANK